jgi:hypothetical protein
MPVRSRLETELTFLLYGLLVTFALGAIVDPDLPGHIRYGLDHMADGHLPLRDPYSYSVPPDAIWINHEWLFEIVQGWTFANLGMPGLIALQALVWGSAGLICLLLMRRACRDFVPTAVLYLLFAAAAFASITIRPQLATFILYACLVAILELARGGRRWLLALVPVIFLAWVNSHGGFLAGLCVLFAYAGGLVGDAVLRRDARADLPEPESPESRWPLALAAVAASAGALAATFLNPYRTGLWAWLGDSLGRPRNNQITEWRTVDLDAQGILWLLLVALTFAALLPAERRRKTPLAHVFVLLGTAFVGVRHARHAPFFAMSALAFAPAALSELYRRLVPRPDEDLEPEQLKRFRWLYAAILLPALIINVTLPNRDFLDLKMRPDGNSPLPTGAYRYMEDHEVEGNMLVYFDWAQLVIWRFHPRVRVFYDGRFRTVYGPELEEAYFDFISQGEVPGWRKALDGWPTEWVLTKTEHPSAKRMQAQPDWRLVYQDPQAMLFRKRQPGVPEPEAVIGADRPPVIPFRPRR